MANELIAGRYRLLEPLGRGAMSAVWLAEDEELGRRVAVKILAPSADRQRFEREARAAAALSHPNICSLYDYGEAEGRPFMVLEYLPNGSLEERLQRGALPDADTQRIATEIAAGLAHAHERGLVHRDLKPANILFDAEGRAKIADFGIARMGGTGTLTEAGTVLGTASYISPEQASGQTAGPASDVYSFGVILFRMLTGALPFVSKNAMELVRMHRDQPAPGVADIRPDAPARLESVTAAALAKDPADRPADGSALLAELRGLDPADATMIAGGAALGMPATAEATQVIRPAAGRGAGRRRLALVAAAVAILLVAGVAVALALTRTGGSGGSSPPASLPGLSLPNVSTAGSNKVSTTAPVTTTAPTTTTAKTTTAKTTTAKTTTAHTTSAPTTTAPPTTTFVPPTTTIEPPTTTFEPPTTTEPPPTTTAPPPTTTAAATTTGP